MSGVLHPHIFLCGSLCEYCLLHLLLKNNPEMFSQHFIEGIFHFNSYSKHKSYNKFSQSDRCGADHHTPAAAAASSSASPASDIPHLLVCREKVRFSLKGPQHREKRFRIYRFLLENFTDAQRFNISNKINQTVLGENHVHVPLGFGYINDDGDIQEDLTFLLGS